MPQKEKAVTLSGNGKIAGGLNTQNHILLFLRHNRDLNNQIFIKYLVTQRAGFHHNLVPGGKRNIQIRKLQLVAVDNPHGSRRR